MPKDIWTQQNGANQSEAKLYFIQQCVLESEDIHSEVVQCATLPLNNREKISPISPKKEP
ncbi:hypothetical protein ASG93_23870 [Paenibacillus sp. Soil787]|nr:hypothetical protein ASG93_23870 [Paenibacillus sp. Soil787]